MLPRVSDHRRTPLAAQFAALGTVLSLALSACVNSGNPQAGGASAGAGGSPSKLTLEAGAAGMGGAGTTGASAGQAGKAGVGGTVPAGAAGAQAIAGQGGTAAGGAAPSGGNAGSGGQGGAGGASGSSTGLAGNGGGAGSSGASGGSGAPSTVCGSGLRTPTTQECNDGVQGSPACSSTFQVLDEPVEPLLSADAGPPSQSRSLQGGRHPLAAGPTGWAVAFEQEGAENPAVGVQLFDVTGTPQGAEQLLDQNAELSTCQPVLAALPDGTFVAAWNDQGPNAVGVALASVSAAHPVMPAAPALFANQDMDFSQMNPDVLWTGKELVVAWVDTSSLDTGPDLTMRTFDASLKPTSDEVPLATTADAEGNVALGAFEGSWAAAWRTGTSDGSETIHAQTGAVSWSVGPILPGPADDVPALTELDATHLLLVFTEGADFQDAGVDNDSTLWAAVLDTTKPGSVSPVAVPALISPSSVASMASQSHPAAIQAGRHWYIAWRASAAEGDANGEELWLKEIGWMPTSSSPTVDLSQPEMALPRQAAHQLGDQRHPALAASSCGPDGSLGTAWEDWGQTLGAGEGSPDVVMEFIPMPLLRLPGGS